MLIQTDFIKKTMLATFISIGVSSVSLNSYAESTDHKTVLEATSALKTLEGLTTPKANSEHFLKLLNIANEVDLGVSMNQESTSSELDAQAAILADDLEKFAADLVINNEKETFDIAVTTYAKALGGELLVRELTRAGGPHAMLVNSRTLLAKNMNDFKQDLSPQIDLFSFLGISTAHAGFFATTCGAFWFVTTAGYGTNLAYRSCYF
jgi:hypothetical protein